MRSRGAMLQLIHNTISIIFQTLFYPNGGSGLAWLACGPANPRSIHGTRLSINIRHPNPAAQGTPQARILEVTTALNSYPPVTLQFDRGQVHIPPDLDTPWGRTLLRMMGFFSKSSQLLHGEQKP